ncbi:MAG: hypothetical protein GY895_16605 [Phycisphaera sp.]|nr:hypothetical protein [Phycisphaera sp.]
MDASGPIPFRAAAAYGAPRPVVGREIGPARGPSTTSTNTAGSIRPATVDRVEVTTSTPVIDRLVAGTVRSDINRGVGFDGDPSPDRSRGPIRPPAANDASLQLYNRHADRLEAATGVALGGSLDIQG